MFYEKVNESALYLKDKLKEMPKTGIVLGSGLGSLVDNMKDKVIISYDEIPHFPKSKLEGHAGNLVFGTLEDRSVVAMQGRFHYYEGFSMKEVTYPIYVMKLLGVEE